MKSVQFQHPITISTVLFPLRRLPLCKGCLDRAAGGEFVFCGSQPNTTPFMSHLDIEPRPFSVSVEGGVTLRGDAWGDPTHPPVLMKHGGGQSRQAWRTSAGKLARAGFHVSAIDSRGHGDSDWAGEGNYGMEIMARDLLTLLKRFDRAPVLVGASMGGMSALLAQGLSTTPLYSALVLVDVTPRMEPDGVRRIVEFMTAHPNGFASLDEAAEKIAAYNPRRERSGSTDGLRRIMRERDGRWHWQWDPAFVSRGAGAASIDQETREAHMDQMAEKMLEAAAGLTIPVLLVRGAQSDVVSEENVKEFLTAVPHAEYVDVSGTGHMVAGDDNDAFTSAVLAFLKG